VPSAATSLISLRRALSERFPKAHSGRRRFVASSIIATGIPALDQLLGGGWPKGRLSELVGAGAGSGSAHVIHALLHRVAASGQFLALIDGMDSFDVDAVEAGVLARLLWVRCTKADEAIKAADILLRDRNFPFVIVDLKLSPVAQLRKIQSSVWHRFRRLQEQNGTTLLVVTPTQLVVGAHCRVRMESKLGIEAMTRPPAGVLTGLQFELLRADEEGAEATQVAIG
jgi:RecA/RadA recombinase